MSGSPSRAAAAAGPRETAIATMKAEISIALLKTRRFRSAGNGMSRAAAPRYRKKPSAIHSEIRRLRLMHACRRRGAARRKSPRDQRLERRLLDVEGTGDRRAERDLDRDHDAALFIGIYDPTEASQCDRALLGVRMLLPVHRAQHAAEHVLNVLVRPLRRRAHGSVEAHGLREVGAAQPHVHRNFQEASAP